MYRNTVFWFKKRIAYGLFINHTSICNRQVLFHKFRQLIFHNPRHLVFHALLLKAYSYDYFCLEFECLQSMTIGLDDSIVINTLARMGKSDTAVMISAAKFFAELLQYEKREILTKTLFYSIVQFIVSLSYDKNTTVRFHAMVGLVRLFETEYKELAIGRLTGMMDSEVYQNKVGLLSRMKKYKGTEDVDYLFRKGQADNHFWVRTIAFQD